MDRIEIRIDKLEERMDARFDKMDAHLDKLSSLLKWGFGTIIILTPSFDALNLWASHFIR